MFPQPLSPAAALASALEDGGWRAKARAEQLPPPGNWAGWIILAGRGFGKTRSGAEWVHENVAAGTAGRIALVAPTAADTRDVMVEGPSGILTVAPNHNRPTYEPSKRRLTWPNGAIATTFSAEESERLRGPNHDLAWADELAAWPDAQDVWDMLMFGLRIGRDPRWLVTTTPKPMKLLIALLKREDVVVTRGSTFDNAANLAAPFLKSVRERYEGTRLGRQELFADLLEDVPGALWTRSLIDDTRVKETPLLRRVVVAIDPAVSNNESSDETGIIVAALGEDDHGYVLEDASGRYAPAEWARKAIALYHEHKADRIVAEVNQGGAMVEGTIRAVDKNVSYKAVHASRGKIVRAEPISALYEQKRVHHVGGFPQLEDQLCAFQPGSRPSPDRLDALVWALTDLIPTSEKGRNYYEYFRREYGPKADDPKADRPEPITPQYAVGSVEWAKGQEAG